MSAAIVSCGVRAARYCGDRAALASKRLAAALERLPRHDPTLHRQGWMVARYTTVLEAVHGCSREALALTKVVTKNLWSQ
jgi:hypothetical protein